MIHDSLHNSHRYDTLHPLFSKAFEFAKNEATDLPEGKYPIDGEKLFIIITNADLKEQEQCKLESHRQYIDIQIVLQGNEAYGWRSLATCNTPEAEFNTESDIIFYSDGPSTFTNVEEGEFVIFFPEDAHAPLCGVGKVRKAIIKVEQ